MGAGALVWTQMDPDFLQATWHLIESHGGSWGLEPQTSTVSRSHLAVTD